MIHKNHRCTAITNPKADAVAIDFFISSIKNDIYGTDNVPPPIPIRELIVPFKKNIITNITNDNHVIFIIFASLISKNANKLI